MEDDPSERYLHFVVLSEIVALAGVFVLLSLSLAGRVATFGSVPSGLRLGALAFVGIELVIPAWVLYDIRRRSDEPDPIWIHAVAVPVVNVLGLIAYLEDRKRTGEQ
ncbi:hypothetical protein ACFQE1_08630 [Halobium palmae]|uniref:DUF805 domain-containing protein n=1 Tax=Halobium palmae TaxID=1776492 RepID=A0ABD5RZ26_9EURY